MENEQLPMAIVRPTDPTGLPDPDYKVYPNDIRTVCDECRRQVWASPEKMALKMDNLATLICYWCLKGLAKSEQLKGVNVEFI